MLEYDIVEKEKYGDVLTAVRDKIADGWEPIGGISYAMCDSESGTYLQAMTRRNNSNLTTKKPMPDPNTVAIMDKP